MSPRLNDSLVSAPTHRSEKASSGQYRGTEQYLRSVRVANRLNFRTPRPRPVLTALIVIQIWTATAFATAVRHNGWLYGWRQYQGGDDLVYHAVAWTFGSGALPIAPIGYAWPL